MWVKIVIIVVFLGIVLSLASGLMFLVKDRGDSRRTLHALSVRIGLSIGLFAFLMLLVALGIIQPHGVVPATPSNTAGQTVDQ